MFLIFASISFQLNVLSPIITFLLSVTVIFSVLRTRSRGELFFAATGTAVSTQFPLVAHRPHRHPAMLAQVSRSPRLSGISVSVIRQIMSCKTLLSTIVCLVYLRKNLFLFVMRVSVARATGYHILLLNVFLLCHLS